MDTDVFVQYAPSPKMGARAAISLEINMPRELVVRGLMRLGLFRVVPHPAIAGVRDARASSEPGGCIGRSQKSEPEDDKAEVPCIGFSLRTNGECSVEKDAVSGWTR